jgi:hypothetical protein
MAKRHEFSSETKEALEKRAGNRCSFPGCPASTSGPSNENDKAVSNTGMACHIAAAADGPGARRYRKMSKKARTSINNGIWMCYTHGKLIDTDEKRFSIPMLKKWREFAEFRAQFRQHFGAETPVPQDKFVNIGPAEEALSFSALEDEVNIIGNALLDSCVSIAWGALLSDAVRDVLVEVVRNAFIHGGATSCQISIEPRAISVLDNGVDFNPLELRTVANGRGGAAAMNALISGYGNRLLLGVKRHQDQNQTIVTVAHSKAALDVVHPCSVTLNVEEWRGIRLSRKIPDSWFSSETKGCKRFYIALPEFMPHSDAILLGELLQPKAIEHMQIVFITENTSSSVTAYLLQRFPFAQVLNVSAS